MSQVEQLIGTRKNYAIEFNRAYDLKRLNPLWIALILSLNEDIESDSLTYHTKILDILSVPSDSDERDWDFATIKQKYGW